MKNKKGPLIIIIFVVCLVLVVTAVVLINRPPETKTVNLVYGHSGGDIINFYQCETTYYRAPEEPSGLDTDAILDVLDPAQAESSRECSVGDFPAMLYEKEGRRYLCWTLSAKTSCVIDYDPAVHSEADIFRMAESVQYLEKGISQ